MGRKILVVDDSIVIHNLLRKALEKHGYKICGDARNGREGIDMYKELNPDIVFMDITMPIMDGLECTKGIMEINPNAKIIMLSAMGDEEIMTEAKGLGVLVFLKKPFDEQKVLKAIAETE